MGCKVNVGMGWGAHWRWCDGESTLGVGTLGLSCYHKLGCVFNVTAFVRCALMAILGDHTAWVWGQGHFWYQHLQLNPCTLNTSSCFAASLLPAVLHALPGVTSAKRTWLGIV